MSLAGLLLKGFGPAGGDAPTIPAAPVLAVADDADGTGGTATITGSTTGATNNIYAERVNSSFQIAAPVLAGTRVGNGTATLDLDPGAYWFVVVSELDDITTVGNRVYRVLTSGDDAVEQQCLDAVQARIISLNLDGLDSDHVYIRANPWVKDVDYPCCIISGYVQETVTEENDTNLRDQYGYAIVVTFIKVTNLDLTTTRNGFYLWRQSVATAHRNQRLPDVDEVWKCTVEPGALLLPPAFQRGYDIGQLQIRCHSLQHRFFA